MLTDRIYVPDDGYLAKCHEICKKYNVLLICDEIQTVCAERARCETPVFHEMGGTDLQAVLRVGRHQARHGHSRQGPYRRQ